MNKSAKELLSDENFWSAPVEQRRKALLSVDPTFGQLGLGDQNKILVQKNKYQIPKTQMTADTSPQLKSFSQSMKEALTDPESVGGMVGGIAGSLTPAPVVGSIVGSAIGGAAGKAGQNLYQGKPISEGTGRAALEQGAFDVVGQGVGKGISKVLAPFAKTVSEDARIANETLTPYMSKEKSLLRPVSAIMGKQTPALMPFEATGNRALDLIGSISEGALFGGSTISKYRLMRETATKQMVDDLAGKFIQNADPDTIGKAFIDTVNGNYALNQKLVQPLYNTIKEQTAKDGVTISTKSIKSFSTPLVEQAKNIGNVGGEFAGDTIVKDIVGLGDNLSIADAMELRSRLMKISKNKQFTDEFKGRADTLASKIRDEIDTSLKNYDPNIHAMWQDATNQVKLNKGIYRNKFMQGLIKKSSPEYTGESEAILKSIFKKGGISGIDKVKAAVDADTFNKLKGWHVQDMLSKATDEKTGEIQGQKLLSLLQGRQGISSVVNKKIFTPEEFNAIKNVATTLKVVQAKNPEGTGNVFIKLTQAGAVMGLATQTATTAAKVTLIGPVVLARMLTNPISAKWLSEGIAPNLSRVQGAVTPLSIKIISNALKEQLKIDEERKQNVQPTDLKNASQVYPLASQPKNIVNPDLVPSQ